MAGPPRDFTGDAQREERRNRRWLAPRVRRTRSCIRIACI
jgi:hypothetical protein